MNEICYKDLKISLHPEIYEPSEDTFQMLESLDVKKDESVLEIGTGSGIIALECARRGCEVVCSDVNPYAVMISELNFKCNKNLLLGSVDLRYGDLFSVLKDDEMFDVIVFNPPYLSSSKMDLFGGRGWFDIAVDGGNNGLFHTIRFLREIKDFVKPGGRVYLIFSTVSDRYIFENFLKSNNIRNSVVSSYTYDGEQIDVYRLSF